MYLTMVALSPLLLMATSIIATSILESPTPIDEMTFDEIFAKLNPTTPAPSTTTEFQSIYEQVGFKMAKRKPTLRPIPTTTPSTQTTTQPSTAYTEFHDKLSAEEQKSLDKWMQEMDSSPETVLQEGVSISLYQTMWGLSDEEAQSIWEEEYVGDFSVFYDSYRTPDYEVLLADLSKHIRIDLNLTERVQAVLEPVETGYCFRVNELYDPEDQLACSFVEKGISLLMAFDAATDGINRTDERVIECFKEFKEESETADPVEFSRAEDMVAYQAAKPSLLYSAAYDQDVKSNHTRIGVFLEEAMSVALTDASISTTRLRNAAMVLAQMFQRNDWARLERIYPTFQDVIGLVHDGWTANIYDDSGIHKRARRAAFWRRQRTRAGSRRMMKAMARLNKGVRGEGWFRSARRVEKNHYLAMVRAINYFRDPRHWQAGAKAAAKLIKNPAEIKWRAAGEMATRAYKLETHARGKLRRKRALTLQDEKNLAKLETPPVFKEPTSKFDPSAYEIGKHINFRSYILTLLREQNENFLLCCALSKQLNDANEKDNVQADLPR